MTLIPKGRPWRHLVSDELPGLLIGNPPYQGVAAKEETIATGDKSRETGRDASLPFGSEFSPSQIDLRQVLELIDTHEGDQSALQAAILRASFSEHGSGDDLARAAKNRNTLAKNCRLGLRAYGIIDTKAAFTAFGRELYALRADEKALYDALAKHILLNLHGMALIQCIRDMVAARGRGEPRQPS